MKVKVNAYGGKATEPMKYIETVELTMSNELDTLIAELRKTADLATPGPWATGCYDEEYSPELYVDEPNGICEGCIGRIKLVRDEDAIFIAAARTLVPALLDALELARAQRDEAVKAHHEERWQRGHTRQPDEDIKDELGDLDAQLAAALKGNP